MSVPPPLSPPSPPDRPRVVAVVPARGGSKGVPRKNVRRLAGRPLLAYTLDACREARSLDAVWVSTEDAEVAAAAAALGVGVVRRPAELARDDTPSLPVLRHAVAQAEAAAGHRFDAAVLLQPTSPLRRGGQIDDAVARFAAGGCDSVVSVCRVPEPFHPLWALRPAAGAPGGSGASGGGLLEPASGRPLPTRRQALPPAFYRNGSVYLVARGVLMDTGSLYGDRVAGLEMSPAWSLNIDTPADWARAEAVFAGGGDPRPPWPEATP